MSDISAGTRGRDEQQLAELGYKQELQRAWGSFTNFAISFGWPVICAFVLLVAVSMAELTSAFPTAGGPYWWAAKLGGPGWSWFTGWFNIVGLLGIVASVAYGAAFFLDALLALYGLNILGVNFGDDAHVL